MQTIELNKLCYNWTINNRKIRKDAARCLILIIDNGFNDSKWERERHCQNNFKLQYTVLNIHLQIFFGAALGLLHHLTVRRLVFAYRLMKCPKLVCEGLISSLSFVK